MDGSFHAIATFLHRVPRDIADRATRRSDASKRTEREPREPDFSDGWIRVAL